MLERFRKEFQKAMQNKADTFVFDGHEFVVDYAKYLIQYLDRQLTDPSFN